MALSLYAYNTSLQPLLLQSQNQKRSASTEFRRHNFRTGCYSNREIQANVTKFRRKHRQSFFEQIKEKWSLKPTSTRDNFPWQQQQGQQQEQRHKQQEDEQKEEVEAHQTSGVLVSLLEIEASSSVSESVSSASQNRFVRAPWNHGADSRKSRFDPHTDKVNNFGHGVSENGGDNVLYSSVVSEPSEGKEANPRLEEKAANFYDAPVEASPSASDPVTQNGSAEAPGKHGANPRNPHLDFRDNQVNNFVHGIIEGGGDNAIDIVEDERNGLAKEVDWNNKLIDKAVNLDDALMELARDEEAELGKRLGDDASLTGKSFGSNGEFGNAKASNYRSVSSVALPWKNEAEGYGKRSNTELAEKLLPEHELKRLRNVSLRMMERIKVGAAGINQVLVDAIDEKWKVDEVVKLKFVGPLSCQMKRTHEMLERRTGGLVVWRSGSSVVLYRGITYKLRCVQTYTKEKDKDSGKIVLSHNEEVMYDSGSDGKVKTDSFISDVANHYKDISKDELVKLTELNHLLDELGPRYKDWCGREPLPVDADLLPAVIPGYTPPLRLRPYGVRHSLGDKRMTFFRRLARIMPPHFALGRNRELEGLADAMVKLWGKSVIAKIAIKRGVQYTCNERMAEELKRLTGGILLSRNKDYIVFYRGNDFLPPTVHETMKERRDLTYLQQDVEEQARALASSFVQSNTKTTKGPLVAGTLAETMAATYRWGNLSDRKEVEDMRKDAALGRRALLVQHLEKKLAIAKGKLKKSDKDLAKVQKFLEPSELPTDLETLTDEERFLFRKIGLSMKPYLLLGRRGVYGGTLENIHLHWKYRELVKVIAKGKTFAHIKHIAISLEAESGGVLISVDKTTKGYAIIIYRGKNYQRPRELKPANLLTRRQALARSIELQRREALKHHILDLQERIELAKSELEEMEAGEKIDLEKTMQSMSEDTLVPDNDEEDGGEEAYLEVYDSSNDDTDDCN